MIGLMVTAAPVVVPAVLYVYIPYRIIRFGVSVMRNVYNTVYTVQENIKETTDTAKEVIHNVTNGVSTAVRYVSGEPVGTGDTCAETAETD